MDGARTHYKSLLESEWLGQWDLQKPDGSYVEAVVEIESVVRYVPQKRARKKVIGPDGREVLGPDGKVQWKDVPNRRVNIGFRGKRKHWLAGPVSQEILNKMFGKYTQDWIGKKITIYVDPTATFGREVTGGLRVRMQRNGAKGPVTEDALDNAVDEETARAIAEAAAKFVDEGDEPEASP